MMAGSEFPGTENEDTENEDTEDPQQLEKTRKMDHAGYLTRSCWCFIVNCIECFYVNDEPESKFLYTETIKLYCKVQELSCFVNGFLSYFGVHQVQGEPNKSVHILETQRSGTGVHSNHRWQYSERSAWHAQSTHFLRSSSQLSFRFVPGLVC